MREVDITVLGLVQGIGYRPFVAELAKEMQIYGTVCNAGGVVKIQAYANEQALDEFIRRLFVSFPRGGRVDSVEVNDVAVSGHFSERSGFEIIDSASSKDELRFLPPDIATCADCEKELLDPANRRYRYPFISCVACGPRFTIMRELPYDRERTSMEAFELCDDCRADYIRYGDIRRHAQTIACEKCGPKVISHRADGTVSEGDEAIIETARILTKGGIAAVKGIGGYHLCFDATCDEAGKRLRKFKQRENKPFAVMFRDIDEIKQYAYIDDTVEKLLLSDERPIVLSDASGKKRLADSVCVHSNRIGAMLPCNPIQILLLKEISPVVMTSANRSGQPMITDDDEALALLNEKNVDIVLSNNRRILHGLDDSIYQVIKAKMTGTGKSINSSEMKTSDEDTAVDSIKYDSRDKSSDDLTNHTQEKVQIIRRARGIVPAPVAMKRELPHDVFAAGGDLKSVFALGRKNMVYLSGVFGDIEDMEAFEARHRSIKSFAKMLEITPKISATDAHPGYASVECIKNDMGVFSECAGLKPEVKSNKRVYHHHAHIASVMAEHGLDKKVLGLAFDGTGYGEDGKIWGSEFLVCKKDGFVRRGHFSEVKTIGGDSPKDAKKSLYAWLYAAEKEGFLDGAKVFGLWRLLYPKSDLKEPETMKKALDFDINITYTTSFGRLFDAVAAGLGVCDFNSYEGECPEKLQILAENRMCRDRKLNQKLIYPPFGVASEFTNCEMDSMNEYIKKDIDTRMYTIDSVKLFAEIVDLFLSGEDRESLALIFHQKAAALSVKLADIIAREEGTDTIALSGGTFQNRLLCADVLAQLEKLGYDVYINEKVPANDGGIALGQAYILSFEKGKDKKWT